MKTLLNICQNEYGCKNDIQWILKNLETFSFDDTAIDYKTIKNSNSCEKEKSCDTHLFCHDEDLEDDDSEASSSTDDSQLSNYIDKIVKNSQSNINSDNSQFPAWTNVMRKHYESKNHIATSSRSENYFKYIKDNVLEGHQPTRADMFLVEHVKTISTRIIEGRVAYEKQQMIQKVSNNTKKVTDNNMLNCEENWRNKNKLRETLELNITENTFSEISLNTIEEKLKQFKNNAEEREMLHESESSKEIILPNVSMSSDLEPKSTVVVIDSSVDECSEDALKLSTNINLSFSKEISTKVNNSLNWSEPKFHSTPV
ncbi:uncharacterized protein LOC141533483 isoform X1 [Cotesia typhae]|uniref:uncharacterized protein LOC141533483 isoform X1 n=1 Tax=Cotesia typhae TaxID=2053667 RepID=UPI003D68A97B